MFKGKTKSGFEFEIDEKIKDDYRFFETLCQAEENPILATKVINMLLGEEEKERLLKHVEKDGFVSQADVLEEVTEIIRSAGDIKN